jgi:hypothetical protein
MQSLHGVSFVREDGLANGALEPVSTFCQNDAGTECCIQRCKRELMVYAFSESVTWMILTATVIGEALINESAHHWIASLVLARHWEGCYWSQFYGGHL